MRHMRPRLKELLPGHKVLWDDNEPYQIIEVDQDQQQLLLAYKGDMTHIPKEPFSYSFESWKTDTSAGRWSWYNPQALPLEPIVPTKEPESDIIEI